MAGAIAAEAYLPVSLATIRATGVAAFQLYIRDEPEAPFRLYRDRNFPFDEKDLQQLASRGVKNLYVTLEDHEQYQQHLRSNFVAILNDASISAAARCNCMNEVVRSTLSTAFDSGSTEQTVGVAKELAYQTVDLITQDDIAAGDLLSVIHHDYHTFTHSANVAYYCVMLARELSIADRSDLVKIAVGGMLHDVGKLSIPESILTKPSRLTDAEFEIIKRHPSDGFRQLSNRDDLNFAQLMMVYQHHERLDGTGYPVGIGASDIHEWAQLCAVIDIYEALSSTRPYRTGLPVNVICDIMDRESGTHFNREMWQCWKKTILSA